jgi:hypothetical protein
MAETETPTPESVRAKLAELNLHLSDDLPWQPERMFPRLTGWGVKNELKTRVKLIERVEPELREMLFENEEIHFVSRGVQNSIVEAMTIGAMWANMINRTVFVLTNLRIILAHCDRHGAIHPPSWMIYYSQIKDFKTSFTGTVTLKLKDGKKYQFSGFPKSDRKAMPALFEEAVHKYQALGFDPDCSQSRENLCSECYTVVDKGEFECEECGSTFWTPQEIALRSMVFPAWGDLIMKHYPFAVFEILGYLFSWTIAGSLFSEGQIAAGLIVLAIAHGVDAAVTYFIARKGLYLKAVGVDEE